MHPIALPPRLVDRALQARAIDDLLAVFWERLWRRVMHDAHVVAHGIPEHGAALVDRQVRVVHVRQAHGVGAKVQVQERLLGLARRIPRVMYAREHALVRRLVRLEHEHAGVEDQLEARVAVHVRDRAEREGHVEQLVKVLSREGVRIDVDHAVDP